MDALHVPPARTESKTLGSQRITSRAAFHLVAIYRRGWGSCNRTLVLPDRACEGSQIMGR